MPNKTVLLAITLVLGFLFPSVAFAGKGPVPVPKIKEGQFVYTPDNCTPQGLSRSQQQALNGRLKNLHNPFYVVILCDLPKLNSAQSDYARSNGFRGDSETKRIEVANAMLMEDWAAEQPDGFDPSNSGVFVISFKPRKYAWHPALRAKNELGLDHRAQDPFTQKFVRAAKQRPADYGSGIANLATAYDDWYYDRTDPVRIAQLKEAERKRQEQRRLQAAQAALDAEILHLAELLDETDYLPEDVSSYQASLKQARKVRKANNPEKMLAEAEQLKSTVAVLDEYVGERRYEHRVAVALTVLKILVLLITIFGLAVLYRRRRREQMGLVEQWGELVTAWDTKVRNAHAKWTEHYLEREDIIGLDGVEGATKELWEKTTKQVDDILVRIRAMQVHQSDCEKLYKRGSFFNLGAYRDAIAAFERSFEFDTEKVNEADLFGGETVALTVDPSNFVTETAALFESSLKGWKQLQKAAEERYGDASEDFPHGTMDLLFELTADNDIPERWIDQHPLYGDDDSDAKFYATLDAIREKDPMAYIERIEEERKKEQDLLDQIKRLVSLKEQIVRVRVDSPFEADTQVMAHDDPEVTLATARQAEDRLAGLLASADEPAINSQANRVIELYRNTAQQRAEILSAIKGVEGSIEHAKEKGRAANRAKQAAEQDLAEAKKSHKRTRPASDSITAAAKQIQEGVRLVERAEQLLKTSNHLDARRKSDDALRAFKASISSSEDAKSHCAQLDAEKAAFEAKHASLKKTRETLARKMRDYGSHATKLAAMKAIAVSDIEDYAALTKQLELQINGWRRSVRKAEDSYEAEQRRRRREREEEERRQRRRREEERRRRSSYSSSYSSSSYGGGFGGGGFGGGGGSFGGGGFGGSSGSF